MPLPLVWRTISVRTVSAVSVTGRRAFALDPVAVMVRGCDEFGAWWPSECPRAVIGRWIWGGGLVRRRAGPGGPPRLALAEGECR